MSILHTTQRSAPSAAKPSRPAKAAQRENFFKRELSAQDAPKIAIGAGLFLALLGAGWFHSQTLAAQHEHERMTKQMQLETGAISADINPNLSPAEADEAQQELQENNPNFQA